MKKLFTLFLILALAPPVLAQINITVSPDSVSKAGVSDSATVAGTAQEAVHSDSSDAAHRAHTAVKLAVSDSLTVGGHAQVDLTLQVGTDADDCVWDTRGLHFNSTAEYPPMISFGACSLKYEASSTGIELTKKLTIGGGQSQVLTLNSAGAIALKINHTGATTRSIGIVNEPSHSSLSADGIVIDIDPVPEGQTPPITVQGMWIETHGDDFAHTPGTQSKFNYGLRLTQIGGDTIAAIKIEPTGSGVVWAGVFGADLLMNSLSSKGGTWYDIYADSAHCTATEAVHAGSSDVTNRAHTAVKFDATDSATFGGHVQIDSTFAVGNIDVDTTGYDVNFYGAEAGGRMFWDEDKMAFRAGSAEGLQWSPDSVGKYSAAFGLNTRATALYSTAFGNNTRASANYSCAGGWRSLATGMRSFAWGCESEANGGISVAFGYSFANGLYSVALSRGTANGTNAIAIGNAALADTTNTVAIGTLSRANGYFSTAFGNYLSSNADFSMTLGSGVSNVSKLTNNIPNSIMFGAKSTTPTMTIVDDTVTVDNTLIAPEIVGNLTGNATTASTCTTWTGSGVVDDSLAALRTDIAALQDTKTDIYTLDVTYVDLDREFGSSSAPMFMPLSGDTLIVDAIRFVYSAGDKKWGALAIKTSGDTLFNSDTLAVDWGTHAVMDSNINDSLFVGGSDGLYFKADEYVDGNGLRRFQWQVYYRHKR